MARSPASRSTPRSRANWCRHNVTDIQTVEAKVRLISGGIVEDVADAIVTLDGLAQRIKELQADAKAAMLERIRESGPFQIGERRYELTKPRKVKCRNANAP